MRKFEYNDGSEKKFFESENVEGVVDFLRKKSWSSDQNEKEFLRKTAKLANMWSGHTFRYDSKESFVKDLMSAGMLREISDEKT